MSADGVEVIPAGERGQFTITGAQLVETGALSLEAFEVLVLAEAMQRGLSVSVSEDFASHGITVRWRPERS